MKGPATSLDYIIIVSYFLFILLFGSYFGRFTKSTKDFFFGGQRFSWWLIAASCVATVVGSYSFIKYSTIGFSYGLSSSMSYLNDWIVMPFFLLGWLPIIYYSRIGTVAEYFERRFNRKARVMATAIILVYLIGYIGINLLTLGVALKHILGTPLMPTVITIAFVCAIYLHYGGQTAVIFTDLLQAVILVFAGFLLFALGLHYLGGFGEFWNALTPAERSPFPSFNKDPHFSTVGIFWQDGIANSAAFYFMNQGVMMRFLSLKSVNEGKKAAFAVIVVLMPIAMIAIANAGWLGRAFVNQGLLPAETNPKEIFVTVAHLVTTPGVFGFVMAALMAALMSTVDTLINAVSAIVVGDIYKPFVRPKAPDSHYLKVAQWVAVGASVVGVALVPLFNSFQSIYEAHGAFTAAVTPPMVICMVLGAFWKRFTPAGAMATLFFGAIMVAASIIWPHLISPFSHGVSGEGGFKYMRALYALVACGGIGVVVSLLSRPKENVQGLVVGSIGEAIKRFKGGLPNFKKSTPIKCLLTPSQDLNTTIALTSSGMEKLGALEGDLLFVRDKRWWYGGLRSAQGKLVPSQKSHGGKDFEVFLSPQDIESGGLRAGERVIVEKII
ncbi:MAG: sodium/solute symporter [Bacteriovoracales bacterium]|nr:sodium/solute symporter [Bacteriovoracales bacterium]